MLFRRIVLSLLAGWAVVSTANAQFPVRNAAPSFGPQYQGAVEAAALDNTPYVGPLWTVNVDYLLWFLKPQHFSTSVMGTTPDPDLDLGSPISSIGYGDPNYVSLLGPGSRERGPYSGVRLSVTRALALSYDRCVYTELAFLWLPQQGNHNRIASSPDGNPALLLPFQTNYSTPTLPAGSYSLVSAGNVAGTRVAGTVDAYTSSNFWGAEWNIAGPLYKSEGFGLEALFGFRYLGLNDLFELSTTSVVGGGIGTFDRFSTTNNFYGGQAGIRFLWSNDRWAALFATKIGMGDTQNNLSIRGSSSLPAGYPGVQLPGGIYTSSANLGTSQTDHFGVVVDLNAGLRFALNHAIGISVGYNFLYWSGLTRAGDQVSTVINPALSPVLNGPIGGAGTGPLQPQRLQDVTDFWAHGVNFGLDIRF